mmetsp:Transcript_45885/g.55213  ORF Transcript_45885/g.55213 Transcript_45885/m.55213 type:complete len:225 (-) Transcript_45885:114-788(-)
MTPLTALSFPSTLSPATLCGGATVSSSMRCASATPVNPTLAWILARIFPVDIIFSSTRRSRDRPSPSVRASWYTSYTYVWLAISIPFPNWFVEVTVACSFERGSWVFPPGLQNTTLPVSARGIAPPLMFSSRLTTKLPPPPPHTPSSPASSTISIVPTLTPLARLSCTDAHPIPVNLAWNCGCAVACTVAPATSASFTAALPMLVVASAINTRSPGFTEIFPTR